MNLDIDNALLLTLMISQSRWSRELITLKSKGSILSWNRICTKVIAAARASLKQASKAADLIRTSAQGQKFSISTRDASGFLTTMHWIFTMIPCALTSQWHVVVSNIIMLSMFCTAPRVSENVDYTIKRPNDIQMQNLYSDTGHLTQLNWMWILILFEPVKQRAHVTSRLCFKFYLNVTLRVHFSIAFTVNHCYIFFFLNFKQKKNVLLDIKQKHK